MSPPPFDSPSSLSLFLLHPPTPPHSTHPLSSGKLPGAALGHQDGPRVLPRRPGQPLRGREGLQNRRPLPRTKADARVPPRDLCRVPAARRGLQAPRRAQRARGRARRRPQGDEAWVPKLKGRLRGGVDGAAAAAASRVSGRARARGGLEGAAVHRAARRGEVCGDRQEEERDGEGRLERERGEKFFVVALFRKKEREREKERERKDKEEEKTHAFFFFLHHHPQHKPTSTHTNRTFTTSRPAPPRP